MSILLFFHTFRNMPRKGRSKLSGPPRRTKAKLAKRRAESECTEVQFSPHDHNYATTAEVVSPPVSQRSPQTSPTKPQMKSPTKFCNYVGNFDNCECIVHTVDSDFMLQQSDDSEGFHIDEHFLIVGTSYQRYEAVDDMDCLALQLLKQEVIKNEHVLSNLNMTISRTTEKLHMVKFYEEDSVKVKLALTIGTDLTPKITVHGKHVPATNPVFKNMTRINNFSELDVLLHSVQQYAVCTGNPDEEFVAQFGFKGKAYLEGDCGADYKATIRSDSCSLLTLGLRCSECISTRRVLNSKKNRLKKQPASSANKDILSSSKPHSAMSRAELEDKLKLMKAKNKNLELQNKRLRIRLELAQEKYKAATEEEAGELNDLVTETTSEIETLFPDPDSFQRIFWAEQVKYNQLKEKSAMRWHPLIVKWALYIRSKSSKGYEAMRESGFINLPSERTLYNYSHCIASELGFQPEALDLLVEECKHRGMFSETEPWKAFVGLLQDEIKLKDDLVYCATTNRLIGYTALDEISNQIMQFEHSVNNSEHELATSALVVMVRGTTTNLKFPLAAFGTKGLTAQQLNNILWQAIEMLEIDAGLKVLFVTCDGAGQNRCYFEKQRNMNCASGEPVNCVPNRYADDRNLYFISDVPHLLKTARNCFANSGSHKKTRHLWKDGKELSWMHIVRLYEEHHENQVYTKGKLTRAHIDLTSFSQMKVSFAAQVFSNRVAAELEKEYDDEVRETAAFVRHMNKFFDICNTRNLYEGKEKLNSDLGAFTDPDDPRLVYLMETFLGYFDEWRNSVDQRDGNFKSEDRVKMQLSPQTLCGLKISVRSIVACVKFLLQQGAPFVLTAVFNQDILEQHFGHYRQKGGACDNPSLDSMRHTMNTLRVVGSQALAPLRGSTKRMTEKDKDSLVNCELPHKKSRPSP